MYLARLTAATVLTLVVFAPIARAADERITVRGSADQVDAAAGRLQLQTADGKTLTLHVSKDTTVEVDGRAAKLADITPGQRVRVTLKQKRAVLNERLEKVKAAAPAAWNELKSGVQKAVEELQRALDGSRSEPAQPPPG